jgi:hypothetical protein
MGLLILFAFTRMDVGAVEGGIQRLQSTVMYDSNDLGVLFMIGLPLAMWLAFSTKGYLRIASFMVLLGIPATVALTGSRGAFLGLVAVAIALFLGVRHLSWAKKFLYAGAAIAVVAMAAPPGYWQQMETIIQPGDDYNLTDDAGRKQIALRGLTYIAQYPLFGVGVDNFQRAEYTLSPLLRDYRAGERMYVLSPHNTHLQVAAELGIPAFVLWVMLIFGPIVVLRRLSKRLPRAWLGRTPEARFLYNGCVYVPVAYAGFLVTAGFVSHAYLPSFYILTGFTAALVLLVQEVVQVVGHRHQVATVQPGCQALHQDLLSVDVEAVEAGCLMERQPPLCRLGQFSPDVRAV